MYDIIIIGAGTAGMTAALYALRANKKILLFEARSYGGQIINAHKIENYPGIESISGFEFATNLYNQIKSLGAEVKYETVIRIEKDKTVITNSATYHAKSIIIATGSENRKLKLEGEASFIGKGISYCATCDGNFYKNKVVAVVGGGNRALEDAIYLADICKKVYLIHRRDSFSGEDIYITELKKCDNIQFILKSNVIKLCGDKNLESIVLQNNDGQISTLELDGLFIAVGQSPRNEIFSNLIELDDNGYIISNDGIHTNVQGIYVAGDCRVKLLRQLATAVGDGANAAVAAMKEMNLEKTL